MEVTNNTNIYMQSNESQNAGVRKAKSKKKKLSRQVKQKPEKIQKEPKLDIEHSDVSLSNNLIDIESTYKFIDLFFKQKNIMYSHLYNSFDKLLDEDIPTFLKNTKSTFYEKVTKDKVYKYMFKYDDIAIKPPFIDMDDEIMFPQHARIRNLTYGSKLVATITQIQEITDIATDTVTTKVIGQPEHEYPITSIPILVRSKYCSLNLKKGYDKSECEYDPGGYFIVNGSEKVVMSLERMIDNRPLVFIKKDSSSVNYTVQVNSKSHKTDLMQIINIRMRKDNTLSIRVPILNEIPVFILMRALGIESDNDIINYCVYDHSDIDMINVVRMSLENAKPEKGNTKIVNQLDALNYLTTKLRVMKRYNETDKDIRQQEKRLHLMQLLKDNFLPHVEGGLVEKAYYLGYMINRLLQCFLGRIKTDDRDSYVNKRVDLPGQLILELFKQYYKKMLNECNKFFKKRNPDDDNPLNIINQIKPNIIEQGLKTALLTGTWGKKKGVAQMLQRLSYLQMLASLRRINSPTVDASTNKLTSPRHLHSSIVGPLCLSWDTEVLLADGVTVKRIGDMTNSDCVTTINKNELTTEPSRIRDKFVKMPDKLLKITTISGREIKCTPEHPLLIKKVKGDYQMIEAGELKTGDCVIVKHVQKYLGIDKETKFMIKSSDVLAQYKPELLRLGMLDRNFRQDELEIMARLLGANITDGNLCQRQNKYYGCSFYLGELEDANELINDIMKLGFERPCYRKKRTYFKDKKTKKTTIYNTHRVDKGGVFAYFLYLIGAFIGKKTNQHRKLPDWIINANEPIIREFLSAFAGGDGAKLNVAKTKRRKTGVSYETCMHSLHQTSYPKYVEETITYMKTISKLFYRLSIRTKVTTYKLKDGNTEIHLVFDGDLNNLNKFADYVGYRYCAEKTRNSVLPIEYIKCKKYVIDQQLKLQSDVLEMHNKSYKNSKIAEITGLTRDRVCNIIKNNRICRSGTKKFKQYDEFVEKYHEKDNIISMAIDKIEEVPIEPVYDFTTVSDNHSFIANGIATSNCFIETSEG